MPLSDLPLAGMFVAFLTLFVLIGLYPALQKAARKIREHLESQGKAQEPPGDDLQGVRASPSSSARSTQQLNDFELLVLWQLSQGSAKGLSRKQINANLHFDPAVLNKTLESLAKKGLVRIAITSLLSIRFYLSEKGRSYSMEQGFIPRIHG